MACACVSVVFRSCVRGGGGCANARAPSSLGRLEGGWKVGCRASCGAKAACGSVAMCGLGGNSSPGRNIRPSSNSSAFSLRAMLWFLNRNIDGYPFFSSFFMTVRGNRPGKPVQLQEYEIKYLCTKAREIFINQPILLELEAPIKICGSSSRFRTTAFFVMTHTAGYVRQVTSMVNTMTFCDFSNMEVSHQKQTTSSSATTLTGANNPSKLSASSSHTRSSTLKTFSSFVETTSVQASTGFTVFMTNVCCPLLHSKTLSVLKIEPRQTAVQHQAMENVY